MIHLCFTSSNSLSIFIWTNKQFQTFWTSVRFPIQISYKEQIHTQLWIVLFMLFHLNELQPVKVSSIPSQGNSTSTFAISPVQNVIKKCQLRGTVEVKIWKTFRWKSTSAEHEGYSKNPQRGPARRCSCCGGAQKETLRVTSSQK